MVFFVCEGCNESLKKNQVDKHAQRCRSCHAVTCVDCSVTFYGDDYAAHTVCVSEAQKYEGSLYKAKAQKSTPQDAWMDVIRTCGSKVAEAPSNIQGQLTKLCELDNIPRNRVKFMNFVKNSLKIYNDAMVEQLWTFLESHKPPPVGSTKPASSSSTEQATPAVVLAEETEVATSEKSKKRKHKKESKSNNEEEDTVIEDDIINVVEAAEETKEERKLRKKLKKEKKEKKRQKQEK